MSFAFMPLYTGDYLRDTQHLSCSEHGIYFKFLMHCWDQKGPLPIDERKLVGICNARSGDEIEAMRRVVREFFVQMDDGHYNRRMQAEIERSENISIARSTAGRRGYEARAKQLLGKSQAIAKQVHLPPPPPPPLSPPPEKPKPSAPSKRIVLGAGAMWEGIPSEMMISWKSAYPAISVQQELAKAAAWILANPKNAKSNYARFLTNWLARAQDKAPRVDGKNTMEGYI